MIPTGSSPYRECLAVSTAALETAHHGARGCVLLVLLEGPASAEVEGVPLEEPVRLVDESQRLLQLAHPHLDLLLLLQARLQEHLLLLMLLLDCGWVKSTQWLLTGPEVHQYLLLLLLSGLCHASHLATAPAASVKPAKLGVDGVASEAVELGWLDEVLGGGHGREDVRGQGPREASGGRVVELGRGGETQGGRRGA